MLKIRTFIVAWYKKLSFLSFMGNQKYLRCLLLECAEVVDAEVGGRAAGGLCAIVLLEFCLVVLPEQWCKLGLCAKSAVCA